MKFTSVRQLEYFPHLGISTTQLLFCKGAKRSNSGRRHSGQTCFGAGALVQKQTKGELSGSREALAQREFLLNVSHELRTPLQVIIGFNELILGTALTGRQRKYAELVRASSKSLLASIESTLERKLERGMEKQGENPFVDDGPAPAATLERTAGAFSILIAEDNPLMRELVLTILQGAGCETEFGGERSDSLGEAGKGRLRSDHHG